ncbi:hypothetical protein KIW84_060374 [Lathyrus oleraceus]|uniref:Sialate O-acetylesterase domain-containing protein n=1 Tax=Pisum sativum TaxID=3888 RepID=A0A9D4W000_PEA|nr:hypothetical protein KIW84_060374 [Pisum sativum]
MKISMWKRLVVLGLGLLLQTRIEEWKKGGRLYNELVKRAIESVRDGDGVIRALVWYQGESDTVREEDGEKYKSRMENFIQNFRLDLQLPKLLVIQVRFFFYFNIYSCIHSLHSDDNQIVKL